MVGERDVPEERVSRTREGRAEQVLRILSLRARAYGASETTLAPGLNIISGAAQSDVAAVRGSFDALTHPMRPSVRTIVEVGGDEVEVDEQFADTFGLAGLPTPVLDLSSAPVEHADPRPTSEREPVSANTQRVSQLQRSAGRLRSELELVRREISREGAERSGGRAGREPAPQRPRGKLWGGEARAGASELHPADVAVMCDRLRDLLDSPAADEQLTDLADRLDAVGAQRVYSIHREEALDQLVAECNDAIRSAEEFLAAEPASEAGRTTPEPDAVLSAGARRARTIARIDLLSELAEFWRNRREALDDTNERSAELLEKANAALVGLGGRPATSPVRAAALLRELAGSARSREEVAAMEDLTAALAEFVGDEATGRSPAELLVLAEARLGEGGSKGGGAPLSEDLESGAAADERLRTLSGTERRLSEELQVVEEALGALQRGSDALEESRSRPNPFGRGPGVDSGRADGRGRPTLARLRALGSVGGTTRLPVLIVEPSASFAHGAADLPELSEVLAAAGPGQVVWVTNRESVLRAAAAMGEDVNHIEV